MPYVNQRWLGGMLTNFQTVHKRLQRLKELEEIDFDDVAKSGMTKKELLVLRREKDKLEKTLGGIRDMARVPSAVWIVDTKKEHLAVDEARKLGIPVVGDPRHQLRPRRGRLQDPGQRRRDPLGHAADPGRRRRRRRGPDGPLARRRRQARGRRGRPATSRWPSGSASSSRARPPPSPPLAERPTRRPARPASRPSRRPRPPSRRDRAGGAPSRPSRPSPPLPRTHPSTPPPSRASGIETTADEEIGARQEPIATRATTADGVPAGEAADADATGR